VFISKPSRNSYSGPRDYRPNSLTSFLLKTMERLVDRYLRDEALALVPLHPNQHAYQAEKSVETAFHQLIVWVEKALDQREMGLGALLNTEGAFNNICFDIMCDAFVRHGSKYTIVRWIRATLQPLMGCPWGSQYPGAAHREVRCCDFYGAWGWMIYSPDSVDVGYLFKAMQMTYVFSRWVSSQTQYQNSCNEPFQP
jgi:hypothetical protein